MTTWYVSATGVNGDGSEGSPWVGFANIAWTVMREGDALEMSGTFDGELEPATSGLLITGGVINNTATSGQGIDINFETGLTIRNVRVEGAELRGVDCFYSQADDTAQDTLIEGCFISGIAGAASPDANGINFAGANNIIRNNTVSNIEDDGIWARGLRTKIVGNVVERVSQSSVLGDNIQIAGNVSDYTLIQSNYCDHSDVAAKQCIIVNSATSSVGTVVSDNYTIMLSASGSTLSNIYDNNGISVLRNKNDGGEIGLQCATGADGGKYVGNTFQNATYRVVLMNGQNSVAHQNTIVGGDRGINFLSNKVGNGAKNCIIVDQASWGIVAELANDIDYICFFNNTGDLASNGGSSGSPSIANTVTDDPLFVDKANGNLHIDTNSPCVRAGTKWWTSQADQPQGQDGMRFPLSAAGKPDMGAYPVREDSGFARKAYALPIGVLQAGVDIAKARTI